MEEFQLPDIVDVSPAATAAAEATLDPSVNPPDDTSLYRLYVDKKTQDEYYRWVEPVKVDRAFSKRSPSGLAEFVVRVTIRPGPIASDNVGKSVYSSYKVNFKVLNGLEDNPGHAIMNRLAMTAITSLLQSTGYYPTNAKVAGIKAELLKTVFPAETDIQESPLVGRTLMANLVNKPNKGDNARFPRKTEIESYLPEIKVEE